MIKYIITATIFSLLAIISTFAEEVSQVLVVNVPDTWKVEYKVLDKNLPFYIIKHKEGNIPSLMFGRSPVPGDGKQIPKQVKKYADEFVAQILQNKGFTLKKVEYEIEQIKGETFSGSFVQFSIASGITHIMFMISDGSEIWNGRFIGTEETWKEALLILTKLKKKD